jgi:hypothetical protein
VNPSAWGIRDSWPAAEYGEMLKICGFFREKIVEKGHGFKLL